MPAQKCPGSGNALKLVFLPNSTGFAVSAVQKVVIHLGDPHELKICLELRESEHPSASRCGLCLEEWPRLCVCVLEFHAVLERK